MNKHLLPVLLASAFILLSCPARAESEEFSFGVIADTFNDTPNMPSLRSAISESDADSLAFVVVNGIKSRTEPCTDQLYNRRKSLLENAENGLVLSMAASDWVECRRNDGRSAAIERLNRLRELFFTGEFSFGRTRIPLVRQSLTPKFRSYGENTRWMIHDTMFATVNLPANNNNYLAAAGRNSEFEDRLVANRVWLQKLFKTATHKRLKAIVIFCDGNPFSKTGSQSLFGRNRNRDGFIEIRRLISTLGSKFPGKVLIVHGQENIEPAALERIHWRNNVGSLGVSPGWARISIDSSLPALFSVKHYSALSKQPAR